MYSLLRWLVFSACLLPFVFMVVGVIANTLGPDPADELIIWTGLWTLRFLLLSLAITPVKNISGWAKLFPFRRTFGLFAFFYGSLHFITYLVFLLQFRWSEILSDVFERPYITAGFGAYIILMLLAFTSNRISIRRLGRRWKQLHSLVYLASILGLLHLVWILRSDLSEAAFYGIILLPLLLYRVYLATLKRRAMK